tara:strand:+ start:34329 stop:35690 length:1362 start_codon:yes stop_codon:yes gene_type:complete
MARVPLPEGFDVIEDIPSSRKSLTNCYNNGEGAIISRPGIEVIADVGEVSRGQFVFNGSLYQVIGTSLIKISNLATGAFTTIGTILGEANIRTAVSFSEAVIIVDGGRLYSITLLDVLSDNTENANFVPCTDVAQMNGRFIYIPSDGDPAFFSDVGAAGTVDSLSFFDAELLPDKNTSVFNLNNTLYIGGTDSIELFRDTGSTPNPYSRIPGASMLNGIIGVTLEYQDTQLFVGRKKDQGFGVFVVGQGNAPKISNQAIDLMLSEYTEEQLGDVIPGRFNWRGQDIATLTFKNDSVGFVNGRWFKLESRVASVSKPWKAGFINQFEGTYYTSSSTKFGKLSKINTDLGEEIERVIDMGFQHAEYDHFSCQSIQLGISQGFNASEGSVALFLSRDNLTYGQPLYRNLGLIGEYSKYLIWNYAGGLGMYDGFMGMRIYTTEDVIFNASFLIVNLR